jgi:predicted MFS family arabinose efflux permease
MKAPETVQAKPLWNREMIVVLAAAFLIYSNVSVFFYFYGYLRTLPIDPAWYGILISVFSAVPLVVRPVVSPLLHPGNSYRFLYLGTVLLMASLALYTFASGNWSMLAVRALHGFSFALAGAALMTVIVQFIPGERSAQVFGLISVIVLIPNTLIPPLLPFLSRNLGGFTGVLLVFALITGLVLPLVSITRSKGGAGSGSSLRPLSRKEIAEDLRDPVVVCLLVSMLLLYSAHALVFFFLDGFGKQLKIAGTGFFLTLSTAGEIGVRVLAGSLFDRVNKTRLTIVILLGLAAGYSVLADTEGGISFFAAGLLLGVGWGVAMPVFNALLLEVSGPRLRAFNTNLGFQMFQAGFFFGPFVGAPIVAGWGFSNLFVVCSFLSIASAALVFTVKGRITNRLKEVPLQ